MKGTNLHPRLSWRLAAFFSSDGVLQDRCPWLCAKAGSRKETTVTTLVKLEASWNFTVDSNLGLALSAPQRLIQTQHFLAGGSLVLFDAVQFPKFGVTKLPSCQFGLSFSQWLWGCWAHWACGLPIGLAYKAEFLDLKRCHEAAAQLSEADQLTFCRAGLAIGCSSILFSIHLYFLIQFFLKITAVLDRFIIQLVCSIHSGARTT